MKENAIQILDALIGHYGPSKYYDWLPHLYFDDEDSILSGEFRNDCEGIILYPTSLCFGLPQLATVINHEYIHYLQSPTWMARYGKTHDYYNHPYEIEAYQREEEWRQISSIAELEHKSALTQ